MRTIAATCLTLCGLTALLLAPVALAGGTPTVSLVKPNSVVPSGQSIITVNVRFMRVVRVYVDDLYQGRRYVPNPRADTNKALRFLVQYPSIATKGRYTIRVEGQDCDGEEIEAREFFVFPTRDRDVQTQLEVDAPLSATAPAASLYTTDTSVTNPADAEFSVTISPTSVVVEPGQKVRFTATVRQGTVTVPDAVASFSASGGSFSNTNTRNTVTYTAPRGPGRYRVVARSGDGAASARVDVGKPVPLRVVSWGINQLRLTGARFAAGLVFVDPNVRPTTTINALLLPADAGNRIEVKLEGLSDTGEVLTARSVKIDVR